MATMRSSPGARQCPGSCGPPRPVLPSRWGCPLGSSPSSRGQRRGHRALVRLRPSGCALVGSPEGKTPAYTCLVGDDGRIWIGVIPELASVATSDVEVVEVDEGPKALDGLLQAAAPLPAPHALAGGVS